MFGSAGGEYSRSAGHVEEPAGRGACPVELLDAPRRPGGCARAPVSSVDFEIVEPAIAMADHLMAVGDKGVAVSSGHCSKARVRMPENADLKIEPLEYSQQPPTAAARPIFEAGRSRQDGLRTPWHGRQADVVERVFRAVVALQQAMLAARFDVEVDIDWAMRAASPAISMWADWDRSHRSRAAGPHRRAASCGFAGLAEERWCRSPRSLIADPSAFVNAAP